jgi:hypothetical protein
MSKIVQPLQSINYLDGYAHDYEPHGHFTRLVEFGWVGPAGFEFSRSGS